MKKSNTLRALSLSAAAFAALAGAQAAHAGALDTLRKSSPGLAAVIEAAASNVPPPVVIQAPPAAASTSGVGLKKGLNMMSNSRLAEEGELPRNAKAQSGVVGALDPGVLSAQTLSLTLADGRTINARVQRTATDAKFDGQSWIGTFDDQPGSLAVITKARGVTTGFVTYGSETFEITPARIAGQHLLYRVDDSKLPTAEPVLIPPAATEKDAQSSGASSDSSATLDAATGGYVHDLLIVYTPASKARYGQATLESMIQSAVQAANQAYQNSAINITLNLVGLQETSYTETGAIQTSLYDIQGTSDGKMDDVHRLRDQLGADIVSLISEDGDACGIAWAMRTESSSFASTAFNVVNSGCLSNHSLAHEVGHNQGNMHDRASTTNTGAFPYSYGYRRCMSDGTGFRTVMAYACSGANRVAWFSSPIAFYNGYPTGIAYESDAANSADNARSMNNTADTVAAFRGAGGGSTPIAPTAPTAPTSLSASATSASSVTVRWADNSSDETGFRLERSTNGVDFLEIATMGAGTTSYSNSGLAAQTTYYYRVRAYNGSGNSGYSNTGSVATPQVATPPPAAPESVAATNNADGSATVNWADASNNETSFEVRREKWDLRKLAWGSATTVGSVPTGVTSLVDMTNSGTFRYTVRAVNSGGASAAAGPAPVTVTGGSSRGKSGK